jgi:hypothetical protein
LEYSNGIADIGENMAKLKEGELMVLRPLKGITKYYWLAFKTNNEYKPLIYFKKSKFITQQAYDDLFNQISFYVKQQGLKAKSNVEIKEAADEEGERGDGL